MYQLYVRPKATYKNVVIKEEKIVIPNMPGTPAVFAFSLRCRLHVQFARISCEFL